MIENLFTIYIVICLLVNWLILKQGIKKRVARMGFIKGFIFFISSPILIIKEFIKTKKGM